MASAWEKVRLTFLPSARKAFNNSKSEGAWGRVYEGRLPRRVENLNSPNGKTRRSKSSIRMGPESSLQPSIKLDYSDTYRENEQLDGNLEEHLDGLKRMEKKQLLEKGEQLKEIRKQVEVITRLQEAVNSRKPGQSAGMVVSRSSRSSIQYGRSNTRRVSRPSVVEEKAEQPVPDVDFATLAQATRTQMRIAAERDKYSAKNLFNVRRPKSAVGNYSSLEKSPVPQTRLFAGPGLSVHGDIPGQTDSSHNAGHSRTRDENDSASRPLSSSNNVRHSKHRPTSATNGHSQNSGAYDNEDKDSNVLFHKTGIHHQNGHKRKSSLKGYLRPTTASRGGGHLNVYGNNDLDPSSAHTTNSKRRPKTAVGFVTVEEEKPDDLLPPRAKSAVNRSRSRRQLELLCRAMDPEVEEAAAAAAALVSGDAREWEMLNEKRRRRKLEQLREEGQQLDVRVHKFLADIDGFNKKQVPAKRRPSSAGFALHFVPGLEQHF